jgi:hypothetical protein
MALERWGVEGVERVCEQHSTHRSPTTVVFCVNVGTAADELLNECSRHRVPGELSSVHEKRCTLLQGMVPEGVCDGSGHTVFSQSEAERVGEGPEVK